MSWREGGLEKENNKDDPECRESPFLKLSGGCHPPFKIKLARKECQVQTDGTASKGRTERQMTVDKRRDK